MLLKQLLSYIVVLVGSALIAFGFNIFLIAHNLLSGGLSGISMIIGYITGGNIGILYFLLNIPTIVWGYFILGRRFVLLSLLSIVATTWFMQLLPERSIIQDDLLASVFGGVLIGVGSGLCLRAGGSSGGFDIIGSILTRHFDFPLGTFLFVVNGIIVLALGYLNNWDLALFSMLSIFVTGKVLDTIHIKHVKVTAFIVTNESAKLLEQLMRLHRGATVIQTRGAFTKTEKDMLMTVTTRYELSELKRIVRELDPKAFVNIVETVGVMGEFRRSDFN